jgi:penicillin-binding protein 1A
MQNLGVKEMGGKTGTTNDNADAWFMGYTPQLLAGVWIGCDDRFISIESATGYGGVAARPIWEAFFKKAFADKALNLDKNAEFNKPADLLNEANPADIYGINEGLAVPDDQQGQSNEGEYFIDTSSRIPAESQAPRPDEEDPLRNKPKKDTAQKKPGDANQPEEKKDKKNFLQRIFKKDDKKDNPSSNDY